MTPAERKAHHHANKCGCADDPIWNMWKRKPRLLNSVEPVCRATAEGKGMTWTDERVESLKKMWSEGLSASQIAAELGGITRNAVIGKVHRLGLSGRAKSPSSAAPRPRKARAHSHLLRVSRPSIRGNTALAHAYEIEVEPEPELVDNVIPLGQRRTILELTEQTCRWPIGDPGSAEFFFCGGQTVGGLPYCSYHSRVAYQPVNDRRRDRRQVRG
jgi:GcrA cell cycle regulator